MTILCPGIPESDSKLSTESIELLRTHINGDDLSLVFFVGAGASMAGNTGMPSTPKLLYQLFIDSLIFSKRFDSEIDEYKEVLDKISSKLGFEITLNDFWQTCRSATSSIYSAFGEMLEWLSVVRKPNPQRDTLSFDFQNAVVQCTKTGVARMVGTALRRGGILDKAEHVLNISLALSETREERSAVLEELSLLHQQIGGRRTDKSRKYLSRARKALGDQPDPWMQLNTDFGMLSQTIVALKNRPWLLPRISGLFRQYRQDIEDFRIRTNDGESAALHESLYSLYQGRLRFKVLGWLAKVIRPLAYWIREPFDAARSKIGYAKEVHVHAHIDVLAYRAVALADLHFFDEAREDLAEIDRLAAILNDDARTRHWGDQKRKVELTLRARTRRSTRR